MHELPGNPVSLWRDTAIATSYPRLGSLPHQEPGARPDVVVIGGGIVGVTAAYLLKKAGLRVWLLENLVLGAGATGRTTAKVTSLHGLVYHQIASAFDDEHAALYGRANQNALEWIADAVAENNIPCDFLRLPAYTFTADDRELPSIEREAEAARRAGLPVSFVDGDIQAEEFPVPAKGAVRFDHQAQFHPLKYLYGLASAIPGDGSAIFEHTRALHIDEGQPCTVETNRGDVQADYVVAPTTWTFRCGRKAVGVVAGLSRSAPRAIAVTRIARRPVGPSRATARDRPPAAGIAPVPKGGLIIAITSEPIAPA
jgi:glycine/D-amino acid oxidase-like deaminating enzyme